MRPEVRSQCPSLMTCCQSGRVKPNRLTLQVLADMFVLYLVTLFYLTLGPHHRSHYTSVKGQYVPKRRF